jgi:hypothetical protein
MPILVILILELVIYSVPSGAKKVKPFGNEKEDGEEK